MTDLIKNLRQRATAHGGDKLLEDAAAEIERLRSLIDNSPPGEIVRVRFGTDERPTWHVVDDRDSVPMNGPKRVWLVPVGVYSE